MIERHPRLIGFPGQLIPSGVALLCLLDPIHIPSVLSLFPFNPEYFLYSPTVLRKLRADSKSANTPEVSSAYWATFISSPRILRPWILSLSLTFVVNISEAGINKYGDNGAPCRTPLPIGKYLEVTPLLMRQLSAPLYNVLIHLMKYSPKLNSLMLVPENTNLMNQMPFQNQ